MTRFGWRFVWLQAVPSMDVPGAGAAHLIIFDSSRETVDVAGCQSHFDVFSPRAFVALRPVCAEVGSRAAPNARRGAGVSF